MSTGSPAALVIFLVINYNDFNTQFQHGCVWFPPLLSNAPTLARCPIFQLNSDIRSHRLRVQSHKTLLLPFPSLQMPAASSGCHLCF